MYDYYKEHAKRGVFMAHKRQVLNHLKRNHFEELGKKKQKHLKKRGDHLEVEMLSFSIRKENGVVKGMFKLLSYKNTPVIYQIKNEGVVFEFPYWSKERKEEHYIKFYETWYENEKEAYEQFIIMYLNKINKIDTVKIFKGKIIKEDIFQGRKNDPLMYDIVIEFEHLLKEVLFSFVPTMNHYKIEAKLDIPINSKGILNTSTVHLESLVKEETCKRLWEPFRDKTTYRLPLLHILR
jgi:hypothetical protein